jgi:7,8-dihydropterin-6-yl-methyl-4-(beta-D-ribofuranosyl)aminobenzene 5'-phosphate synthase
MINQMDQIKSLKFTTLADNLVRTGGLGQWGFSLLIEIEDTHGKPRKIMLDTAQIPQGLLYNIKHMELDISDLDCLVLSHNHYDHTATNTQIVKEAGGVKIYAHPRVFEPHIYTNEKGKTMKIGVPEGQGIAELEAAGGEVILSSSPVEVVPGVWTTGEVPRTSLETPIDLKKGAQLLTEIKGEWKPDNIVDDQSLWMKLDGFGAVVASGCAHAGIVNTLNHVKDLGDLDDVACFVGGPHLDGRSDEYLERTVSELGGFGFKLFSPCHCTSFKAKNLLWKAFPEAFVLNYCCCEIDPLNLPENKVW